MRVGGSCSRLDGAGTNNDPATGLYNFSGDERITKAGTAWPSDEDVVGVSFAVIGQGTGSPGADGDDGPSPVFSVHSNGSRRVLQLEGYSDPTTPTTVSDAPSTPTYVGVSGFTTTLADAVDLRGPGLQRGEVWATITIPAIAAPSSEWLNISTVTKEADAPAQLTVHSGTQRNIRISPNWDPPSGMYGWHIVPFIDSTEYPGRCFVPLGSFTNCFPNFNNTSTPSTFYGCRVQLSWGQTNMEQRFDFGRFGAGVGTPSDATLRIYPAVN